VCRKAARSLIGLQERRYISCFYAAASSSPAGFAKNLHAFATLRVVFYRKKPVSSETRTFFLPLKHDNSDRLRYGIKKMSEIMERIEKNRKQRFTSLPINISWVFRIILVLAGFYLWGYAFIWAILGFYLILSIIRKLLSCLMVLLALIALFILLATIIFNI
jgi:hypothetical protein